MTPGTELRNEVNEFVAKAVTSWKGAIPPGTFSTWLGRAAVVLAESGDAAAAASLLDQAVAGVDQIEDSITSESTLAEVSSSFAAAGCILHDPQLLERSRQLAYSVRSPATRALALAALFRQVSTTGERKGTEAARNEVLPKMHELKGLEYVLVATEVVKTLACHSSGRDDVVTLLEAGFRRGGQHDRYFGDTIHRDVASSYASVGRMLGEKELVTRAVEICKTLPNAKDRASVYGDVALSCAALGYVDEARKYRDELERESNSVTDSWDRERAIRDCAVSTVLVGSVLKDSQLVTKGFSEMGEGDERQVGIATALDQLLDLKLLPNDPTRILEVASRLEGPLNWNYRLPERIGLLCQLGRGTEAEALLTQAQSDVDSLSDPVEHGQACLAIASAKLQALRWGGGSLRVPTR